MALRKGVEVAQRLVSCAGQSPKWMRETPQKLSFASVILSVIAVALARTLEEQTKASVATALKLLQHYAPSTVLGLTHTVLERVDRC